jgi:hypothetical protein
MPKAKSQAQARKFGALFSEGKISRPELETRVKGVKVSKLPMRVKKKK